MARRPFGSVASFVGYAAVQTASPSKLSRPFSPSSFPDQYRHPPLPSWNAPTTYSLEKRTARLFIADTHWVTGTAYIRKRGALQGPLGWCLFFHQDLSPPLCLQSLLLCCCFPHPFPALLFPSLPLLPYRLRFPFHFPFPFPFSRHSITTCGRLIPC